MPNGMTGYAKLGNGTIGGVGVGSEFDAWSFSYSDGMKVTITLNRNGCIPVVEISAKRLLLPSKRKYRNGRRFGGFLLNKLAVL